MKTQIQIQSFEYFPKEDVMYIALHDLKPSIMVAENELQDSVILYKGNKKVLGIEIQNFSKFRDFEIILSKKKTLDLSYVFEPITKWSEIT